MGTYILLIEDNAEFANVVARHLVKEGHQVECATSGEQGLRAFAERTPDVVLLDLMLPGMDGLAVLQQIKRCDESSAVIVMTAHASVATAVEAMRLGALDYVTKPIDLEALGLKLEHAREVLGLRADLSYLLERERQNSGIQSFIGNAPVMCAVYDRIREVAKTSNTTVLITGPSGTGKEVTARAIHALSSRRGKPLMQIDCTALPLALLESELFGHERGAFTGADRVKKGLLELADGGTLLLDEIGDMDLGLQAKFLRVLEERQFRRVGGTRDLHFDVRVVAATNQDLERLAEQQRFRRDLLYRLKVFQIELPPLSQRGQDILELADAFLRQYARAFNKRVVAIAAEARQALLRYSFPGNVRELRNIIEQAVILAQGETITQETLSLPSLPREPALPAEPASPSVLASPTSADASIMPAAGLSLESLGATPLQTAERELIRQALEQTGGNKKRAAELLGISRFALQRRLDRLALESLRNTKT